MNDINPKEVEFKREKNDIVYTYFKSNLGYCRINMSNYMLEIYEGKSYNKVKTSYKDEIVDEILLKKIII